MEYSRMPDSSSAMTMSELDVICTGAKETLNTLDHPCIGLF
jgi:hypothetical protein